jgi:hypothetical protein
MPRVPNESQVKWNARAKNDLFEAISEEIFGMSLKVLKEKLNEFNMLPNELVEQMYSRLNVLVEYINDLKFLH